MHQAIKDVIKLIFIFSLITITLSLGEVFNLPQTNELQIIRIAQTLYFSQNTTLTLPYTSVKTRLPNALITYNTINSNHYNLATPQFVSWFNIRSLNVTTSQLTVYSECANEQNSTLEYHTFNVMVSCIENKYFQIVNWQYTGPRMIANDVNFFTINISPLPQPFAYCFSDPAHTLRQNINFMLNYNGVVGANWLSLSRDASHHSSRLTFHIYPSSATNFTIYMYSDHRTWVDKYFIGLLFICPTSYLLRQKYYAEMQIVSIGNQLTCEQYSTYAAQYLTMQTTYPYLEFIGTRFIIPNLNKTSGFTFVYQFSLDASVNASRRYYQAWQMCGRVDYNVLFIAEKLCEGNRTLVEMTGKCECDNLRGFYDTGVVDCVFTCTSGMTAVDYECKACDELYGAGCTICDNTTCTTCDNNFILAASTTCTCADDRAIFNSTECLVCNTVYDSNCQSCNSTQCLQCKGNFVLDNGQCTCQADRFLFSSQCFLCGQVYGVGCAQCDELGCAKCGINWTRGTNGSCQCKFPHVIDSSNTTNCLAFSQTNSNTSLIEPTESFTIAERHVQLGSTLFLQLQFNRPFNEITEIIPLQTNIVISYAQQQVKFEWHNANHANLLLEIQLQKFIQNQTLSITVTNPKYLNWRSLPLQNQLSAIIIEPFMQQDAWQITILSHLCLIIQWLYPLTILLSLGTLTNGFQSWFILSYYLYVKTGLYGGTEAALLMMNKVQLASIIPFQNIPHLQIYHENVVFIQKVLNKNIGITEYITQIILIYIVSIGLCLAIRFYVKLKPNNHTIYENFLNHYKEYITTNFLALYPFIAFTICVQFQNFINSEFNFDNEEQFANFIISVSLLLVMTLVPFLIFFTWPMQTSSVHVYSVIYNKLHPSGCSILIQHLIHIFRTTIITSVIFCTRQHYQLLGELSLIGLTLTCLLLTIINFKKHIIKLYWAVTITKSIILLAFQMGFLFLKTNYHPEEDGMMGNDSTCIWLIILLIMLQIAELVVKLVPMLLANRFTWKEVYPVSNKILPTEMEQGCFSDDKVGRDEKANAKRNDLS